jgi:hypothetical protein
MTDLTAVELAALPFTVLFDPVACRGAAYNKDRRMITPNASAALVSFARMRHVHQAAWCDKRHGRYQMPEWATPEVRCHCVLIWVREDSSTNSDLESIPKS